MNDRLPAIVGRTSSHFTRVVRMFAAELSVPYRFVPVTDLTSADMQTYAGNPALKLPIWVTATDTWFGAVNICRELSRRAHDRHDRPAIVWPEDLCDATSANAWELTQQGMATEVALIMQRAVGASTTAYSEKLRASLEHSVAWLDTHLDAVLAAIPQPRDLSLLEVALFCFATHLPFREVLQLDPYPKLRRFCDTYAERPAAVATMYRN